MYVQDVELIADDGQEVAVQLDTRSPWQTKDVAMLDFSKTDLKQVSECHSGGAACGAIFESAGVNFDTGASSSAQTFYTLE